MKYDEPFPHWVIDTDVSNDAVYWRACFEVAESLKHRSENKLWKGYCNDCEEKLLADDPKAIGPAMAELVNRDWLALAKEHLRDDFIFVSGLLPDPTGYGGKVHVMRPDGFLGCHLDREILPDGSLELRLAVVAFVVPQWKADWGGELEFYDDAAWEVVARVLPAPGRVVFWQPSSVSFHGVRMVEDMAANRVTINPFYYSSPPRPGACRKRALFIPPR